MGSEATLIGSWLSEVTTHQLTRRHIAGNFSLRLLPYLQERVILLKNSQFYFILSS
jgi:hypothetical protein